MIGYTTGTFDCFHDGHVAFLARCKAVCDQLWVGCTSDELVAQEKKKQCAMTLAQRLAVVGACRHVDLAIPHRDSDKLRAWQRLHFGVLIIGDDWAGSEQYARHEEQLRPLGVHFFYFPYSVGVSTTSLRKRIWALEEAGARTGVNGPIALDAAQATKRVALTDWEATHPMETSNAANIEIPPPRSQAGARVLLPGINAWREVYALRRLQPHPNVVQLLHFSIEHRERQDQVERDAAFPAASDYAQERALSTQSLLLCFPRASSSLQSWSAPLPLLLGAQLFNALAALEAARIVHSDIKESNVLLSPVHARLQLHARFYVESGQPLLLLADFGWSCCLDHDQLTEQEREYYEALLAQRVDVQDSWEMWGRIGLPAGLRPLAGSPANTLETLIDRMNHDKAPVNAMPYCSKNGEANAF